MADLYSFLSYRLIEIGEYTRLRDLFLLLTVPVNLPSVTADRYPVHNYHWLHGVCWHLHKLLAEKHDIKDFGADSYPSYQCGCGDIEVPVDSSEPMP